MTVTDGRPDATTWFDVCAVRDLVPDRGAAALVAGEQVALFRLSPDDEVVAISNIDPFSGAAVLSRGIVGSRGEVVKVSSPVFKQSFDLRSGRCLDDPAVSVASYPVRVVDGRVQVGAP